MNKTHPIYLSDTPNLDAQPDDAPDKVSTFALKLWARLNERRCHLIERNHNGGASEAERIELAQLQTLADECVNTFAPLPIAELEAHMKSQGIDAPAPDELAQKDSAPASYRNRIMDIPCAPGKGDIHANAAANSYLHGHLSALHDAAKIADEAEARIRELEAQLASANARAETAERRAEDADFNSSCEIKEKMRLRAALEAVVTYFAADESGPIYSLWANGDICSWDDNPRERWTDVLADLADDKLSTLDIGHGVEWEAVLAYRAVLSALSPRGEGNE